MWVLHCYWNWSPSPPNRLLFLFFFSWIFSTIAAPCFVMVLWLCLGAKGYTWPAGLTGYWSGSIRKPCSKWSGPCFLIEPCQYHVPLIRKPLQMTQGTRWFFNFGLLIRKECNFAFLAILFFLLYWLPFEKVLCLYVIVKRTCESQNVCLRPALFICYKINNFVLEDKIISELWK